MLIGWWMADISLVVGLILGFFVISAELVLRIRNRSNLAGSATIRTEFVSCPSQEDEISRTPVAVFGKNIDKRD
ncbi:MAG: hypothetical protein GTO55_03425 [Armatimonadetes bacterium]|nr:hypothetical protein [Armatimonadota bacterium]NIM23326.1 hypothetical protein [Armatimonadota bacterium]NIM67190.1 hypothetical protein [Armatimonadota bacterium]NIN05379.1 hypothetical protein [Armatimonadota bacterium]NIO74386.1 hypothetical protein [Armatimonadota bacterium]